MYLEALRVGHETRLALQPSNGFRRICFGSIDAYQELRIITFIPLANILKQINLIHDQPYFPDRRRMSTVCRRRL
jgi:hypothetical protein